MDSTARILSQEDHLKKRIVRGMVGIAISFPMTLMLVGLALTNHQDLFKWLSWLCGGICAISDGLVVLWLIAYLRLAIRSHGQEQTSRDM